MAEPAWRPIESAPKDQDIIVFSQRWGSLIAEFSSEFGQWFPRMQCPSRSMARTTGSRIGCRCRWHPKPVVVHPCAA
jgi:hypothetical protein